MSITVKTFNMDKINKLIKNSDPELQLYIKRLKEHVDRWEQIAKEAISKLRSQPRKGDRYLKGSALGAGSSPAFPLFNLKGER